MKKYFLFILILFYCKSSIAKLNYINYHKQIIVAETYFLFGYNDSSILEYRKIFKEYRPFAKDCFTALQISCLTKRTSDIHYFFDQAVLNGMNWKAIEASPFLHKFLKSNDVLNENLQVKYDSLRALYLKSINIPLRFKLESMLNQEDLYKSVCLSLIRENYKMKLDSAVVLIFEENIRYLVDYSKKYGFPGERVVGITDPDIGQKGPNSYYLYMDLCIARMLFHYRCGYQLLKKELLEAVVNGQIQPREYAFIYEWSFNAFRKGNWQEPYLDKNMCAKENKEKEYNLYKEPFYYSKDITFVNKCRAEIGIASLQHDEKKKEFEKQTGLILFYGMLNQYY